MGSPDAETFDGDRDMSGLRSGSLAAFLLIACCMGRGLADDRPNILWITSEDISPNLGCYGDTYAVTPNLDQLATEGVRYTRAFAPIGVCAPARSCLITGMYACSLGSQHMRCKARLPDEVRCFPQYLREAGYYCTNNVKTDYNFDAPPGAWDESSNKAHWRKRAPNQPFFSVFNFTSCHESQIRLNEAQYQARTAKFTEEERHDPNEAPLPPYHPDTPEVRQDWARYADMITYMDQEVGRVLRQLDEDGLRDNTIVFYFSDHGAGMPRSKRWLYDSSTRVPFLLRVPDRFQSIAPGEAGSVSDRLVSFVDFAPSVLSLAGVDIPKHLQGQAFLGAAAQAPREYIHGYRDRMDERIDLIRSTRDGRYKYIRNYLPHLPYFHHQHIGYMYEMPTMQVWQRLADEGRLTGAAATFMALSKPTEELYDTQTDPWETTNLATSAEHQETLRRLRAECRRWQREIVDLGLMPEADLRSRFGDEPPYTAVRRQPELYPLDQIEAATWLANARDEKHRPALLEAALATDAAVRYWAAIGLGCLAADPATERILENLLKDSAGSVRVAAADALGRTGKPREAVAALQKQLSDGNDWVRLQAICALDRYDEHAEAVQPTIRQALEDRNDYVVRVAEAMLAE